MVLEVSRYVPSCTSLLLHVQRMYTIRLGTTSTVVRYSRGSESLDIHHTWYIMLHAGFMVNMYSVRTRPCIPGLFNPWTVISFLVPVGLITYLLLRVIY